MCDLKWNLISILLLDDQGYIFNIEDGDLRITNYSMVLMKGKLENGLSLL